MTKQPPIVFSERPVVILDLPLAANTRLLNPDQVMLKIDNDVHDVGAFCYTLRSNEIRQHGKSRHVVLSSFRKERGKQIRQVIRVFSSFLTDAGKRPATVGNHLNGFKKFMDWADANGCPDCLAGGDATRSAYRLYAQDVEDQVRRHKFESAHAFFLQTNVLTVLEAMTGIADLDKGIRLIRNTGQIKGGTEPTSDLDFAHALALNESLFKGLCALVLDNQPFPFKLTMPKSLGWEHDFLWLFPTSRWFLPPHLWGEARAQLTFPYWNYNYEQGRAATFEEVLSKCGIAKNKNRKSATRHILKETAKNLERANSDPHDYFRRMLAMIAHNAFYFLFLANTGGNASPIADIETNGILDETTANPGYRTTKWRAGGKEIKLIIPVAFVPTLRRFMDLRRYLLIKNAFPYMFLSFGSGKQDAPRKISNSILNSHSKLISRIDPQLPAIGTRKLRATVSEYYRRKYDAAIEAAVLQHTESTAAKSYNAGTASRQQVELTLLMEAIAQKAQQKVVKDGTVINGARKLEDGGVCPSFGQPESMSINVPVIPNCKTGCLFCTQRVLIAGEEDTRKLASAAFLMEQLIIGQMSEAEFRPQITKCDDDLAKIQAFEGCEDMVDRIKRDVYENGNLTPYFADKYQLFLTLGIL